MSPHLSRQIFLGECSFQYSFVASCYFVTGHWVQLEECWNESGSLPLSQMSNSWTLDNVPVGIRKGKIAPDDMQTNELIPGTDALVSVNSVSVAQNGFDIKRGRSKSETSAISFRSRDTSLQTRKLSFCVCPCCLLRRVLFYLAISLVERCQLLRQMITMRLHISFSRLLSLKLCSVPQSICIIHHVSVSTFANDISAII